MQPCSRIYYSSVSELLNMFRATPPIIRRSRTVIATFGFTYVFGCRPLRWFSHRSGRQPKTYVKEAAITVFELLMMGGVSLETCWAIKKHRNNKSYYTVASYWFFLWEQSPFSELNISSARHLWNQMFQYCFHHVYLPGTRWIQHILCHTVPWMFFVIFFPSMPRSSSGLCPSSFLNKFLFAFLLCPVRATCSLHLAFLNLITLSGSDPKPFSSESTCSLTQRKYVFFVHHSKIV